MKVSSINTDYDNEYKRVGICPFCGTTQSDINISKKAGCAFCYEIFDTIAESVTEEKFGSVVYKGKVPGKAQAMVPVYKSNAITVSPLSIREAKKRLLDLAIKEERFEDAAILRDEIKEIDKRSRGEYNAE